MTPEIRGLIEFPRQDPNPLLDAVQAAESLDDMKLILIEIIMATSHGKQSANFPSLPHEKPVIQVRFNRDC
jgi:hypothetical protein